MSGSVIRFAIVAAERTGTSLLGSLLGSHPEALYCGELFNPDFLDLGTLPVQMEWAADPAALVGLRASDPARFLDRVVEMASEGERRAIGWKVLYSHPDHVAGLRECLGADKGLRVFHLKRRNLLRRLLSEKRARATGVWWRRAGAPAGEAAPRMRIEPEECLEDFSTVQAQQGEYDELFRHHQVLGMSYEDLASDPIGEGACAVEFLGLDRDRQLKFWSEKTGVDTLREAITNYDELKDALVAVNPGWLSFFDD